MSHYSQLQTRIVSAPHLVRALTALGCGPVELHDRPVALAGFHGIGGAVAEVVLRAGGGAGNRYDLGFSRDPQGCFRLQIVDEDRTRIDSGWIGRLHQQYAREVTRDVLAAEGFELAGETVEGDRTVRLTLRRMT